MSPSIAPQVKVSGKGGGLPLRPWLLGLALLTVVAAAERVVRLAAPRPTRQAPALPRLAGYRVSVLAGEPARHGRELSLGTLRRYQLEPLSGEPPLVLSLLPVSSRTGTEFSEASKERKGLNMVAVEAEVPSFALVGKRVLSVPRSTRQGPGATVDQIALGRGPKDPTDAITRLQTCVTPRGVVALSASTLVGEGQEGGGSLTPGQWVLRLAGLRPVRHECLAVQLTRGQPGQGPLVGAWKELRGVLVRP